MIPNILISSNKNQGSSFLSTAHGAVGQGRLLNLIIARPPKKNLGWAGLPPCGQQLKVAVRIFVKKSSDFVQKVIIGGDGRIRTSETREGLTVFETAPFDHSGTSPYIKVYQIYAMKHIFMR